MIFIDTGAFLAKYLSHDQHHAQALSKWRQISTKKSPCCTSNFVLDETLTLLARWADYNFAAETADIIYNSTRIAILRPDQEDEIMALDLFRKYADQKVSFTDCISFALLKKQAIQKVFSFDKHFKLAGFDIL